jgi:hypothetical protein
MASVFSGSAGRKAAMWTAQMAGEQLGALTDIYGKGYGKAEDRLGKIGYMPSANDLRNYYNRSNYYQTQGLNRANKLLRTGMTTAAGDVTSGYGAGIDTLNQMYGQGAGQMQKGVGAWQDFLGQANQGYGMYQNALGLGGAQGRADAQSAFQAGPGYQWNVDQATSQAQRAANRTGQLYGGNTQAATTQLAQNLANQEWGNWVQNLSGFQGAAQAGTQGYAGQLNSLADLYGQQGQAVSGLQAQQGKDLAAIHGAGYGGMANNTYGTFGNLAQGATQYGQDRASLSTNYGNALAGTALGYMGDVASATNNYYNTVIGAGQQGMMAGQQAAGNRMGAMMGAAQMGGQLLGGLFGGGGGFLGGLFK